MLTKNYTNLLLITLILFCSSINAQQPAGSIPVDCKWNSTKQCYEGKITNGICKNFEVPYPYYASFTDSGGFFNKPISNNCQPWSFLMYQNNCADNPNFNWNSYCNRDTTSPYLSWITYPRVKIVAAGRKGLNDSCLNIWGYPGDHIRTGLQNSRSEITLRPEMGEEQERYYSWSFKFPANFVDDDVAVCPNYAFNHYFIAQIHQDGGAAHNCAHPFPVFFMNYFFNKTNHTRKIKVAYGRVCSGTPPSIGDFSIQRGKWYDIVVRINWTSDPDTTRNNFTFEAYQGNNLLKIIQGYGPNLYYKAADTTQILPLRYHFGLYRGGNTCVIQNFFYDEFSMAADRCSLQSTHTNCNQITSFDPKSSPQRFAMQDESSYELVFLPSENQIHLILPDDMEEKEKQHLNFRLYDTAGRQVSSHSLTGLSSYTLGRDELKNGLYFFAITNETNQKISNGKLLLH